jgi:hypothetical protein
VARIGLLAEVKICRYLLAEFEFLMESRMRPNRFYLALSVLALFGCASSSVVNQQQDPVLVMIGNQGGLRYSKDIRVLTTSVAGTPASLWPKLNAAYSTLGLPLTARDSTVYALAAQNAQVSGRFGSGPVSRVVDCGLTPLGTPRANAYHVWLTVATQLQPSATGTTIRTTVTGTAQDQNSSSSSTQCGTTGVLEHEIAKALGAE